MIIGIEIRKYNKKPQEKYDIMAVILISQSNEIAGMLVYQNQLSSVGFELFPYVNLPSFITVNLVSLFGLFGQDA